MQHLVGIAPPKRAQVSGPVSGENGVRRQCKRFRCQHRLIKHQVAALLHDGARFTRAELVIKLVENSFGQGRLAIAVPKRILKSAVDRNRVKRVIRDEFRQNAVRVPPVDLLVMLRARLTTQPGERRNRKHENHQLRETLTQLLGDVSRRFATPG